MTLNFRFLIFLFFQIDPELVPFEVKGPLATPPVKDYDAPDGDYIDTTKVFDKW